MTISNESRATALIREDGPFVISPHVASMGPRGAISQWIVIYDGEIVFRAYDESDCSAFCTGAQWQSGQVAKWGGC